MTETGTLPVSPLTCQKGLLSAQWNANDKDEVIAGFSIKSIRDMLKAAHAVSQNFGDKNFGDSTRISRISVTVHLIDPKNFGDSAFN